MAFMGNALALTVIRPDKLFQPQALSFSLSLGLLGILTGSTGPHMTRTRTRTQTRTRIWLRLWLRDNLACLL